jgi:hypothetical protein
MDRMEQILKKAQDSLTVIVAVQDRRGRMLVSHEEWLEQHTQDIARHREFVQQHEAAMQRIEANLELLLKGQGGNGGGSAA